MNTIVIGHDHWRMLGQSPRSYDGGITDQPLVEALREQGYRKGPILIALASELCLAAIVTPDNPRQVRKRQAMLYKMEQFIPWTAEEYTADWIHAGGQALMVACETPWLVPVIEKLETEGYTVRSIVPYAMLVAQHADADKKSSSIIQSNADLFLFVDGILRDWRVAGPGDAAERVVGEWQLTHGDLPVVQHDDTAEDVAAATAERILKNKQEPWIELRRDQLVGSRARDAARRYWSMFQLAASLLLIITSAAFYWRGMQYAEWADALASRQASVFEQVFPGKRVPVGIRMRLENEAKRLRGLRGDSSQLAENPAALAVLHPLLASLPDEMRFRVLEIRIEEGGLFLVGEVRTHSDADKIAAALRQRGFSVTAPSTHRLPEQGVEFRISAERET